MMSDKVNKSIQSALEQLHDERERIEGAIAKLEGFLGNLIDTAAQGMKRRSNASESFVRKFSRPTPYTRSRAGWTEEARSAAAERMRAYWASRRTEDGGTITRTTRTSKVRTRPANSSYGVKQRSRKGWTPEARQAAAERMRAYWASRHGDESSEAAS